MDIIKELYDRNLYFIVEDIFTFLDVRFIYFISYKKLNLFKASNKKTGYVTNFFQ